MAMYVYKDVARTEKLLARNAQKQDKGIRYYCPNPKCDAHMHVCNIEGVSASYFSANRSHGHIERCPYGTSNGFNPSDYNEDKFEFDNALLALTMSSIRRLKKKHQENMVVVQQHQSHHVQYVRYIQCVELMTAMIRITV